jgi:hypothetical protein
MVELIVLIIIFGIILLLMNSLDDNTFIKNIHKYASQHQHVMQRRKNSTLRCFLQDTPRSLLYPCYWGIQKDKSLIEIQFSSFYYRHIRFQVPLSDIENVNVKYIPLYFTFFGGCRIYNPYIRICIKNEIFILLIPYRDCLLYPEILERCPCPGDLSGDSKPETDVEK